MLNKAVSERFSPVLLAVSYVCGSLAWFLAWGLFVREPRLAGADFL